MLAAIVSKIITKKQEDFTKVRKRKFSTSRGARSMFSFLTFVKLSCFFVRIFLFRPGDPRGPTMRVTR